MFLDYCVLIICNYLLLKVRKIFIGLENKSIKLSLLILLTSIGLSQEEQYSIELKNGNTMTGELLSKDESSVTLKTEFGELVIPKENIQSIVNLDTDNIENSLAKTEQERMDSLLESFNLEFLQKNIEIVSSINTQLDKAKSLIAENKGEEAISAIEECKTNLSFMNMKIKDVESDNIISNLKSKNEIIKEMQEGYAETYSKNQNIKKESVKRNERIKIIDQEIDSWKNLLNNSEKMSIELNERKNKQNLKLNELEKQPQTQAEKKGQISENLRISEKEKNENEILIEEIDGKIIYLRNELDTTKENWSMWILKKYGLPYMYWNLMLKGKA